MLDVSALAPAVLDEADDLEALDELVDHDHDGHDHAGHDHDHPEGHDHDHGDGQ